jgi:hypothetical protein
MIIRSVNGKPMALPPPMVDFWLRPWLQRLYGNCSCSGIVSHDGSEAHSHAMTQGDAEFELEVNPDSKSVTWLL